MRVKLHLQKKQEGVWQSRAAVERLHWGLSVAAHLGSRTALDLFPLEGKTELLFEEP